MRDRACRIIARLIYYIDLNNVLLFRDGFPQQAISVLNSAPRQAPLGVPKRCALQHFCGSEKNIDISCVIWQDISALWVACCFQKGLERRDGAVSGQGAAKMPLNA